MVPSSSRRVIAALSTVFLLGFLWYKRKRSSERSDPGGASVDVPVKTLVGGDSAEKPSGVEVVREPRSEVEVYQTRTFASVAVADVEVGINPSESPTDPVQKKSSKFVLVENEPVPGKTERIADLSLREVSGSEFCIGNKEDCIGCETLVKGIEQNLEASSSGVIVFEGVVQDKDTNCEVVEEKCEQRTVAISVAIIDLEVVSERELVKEVPIVEISNLNPNAADFILNTCGTEKEHRQVVNVTRVDKVEVEEPVTKSSEHTEESRKTHTDKDRTDLRREEATRNGSITEVSAVKVERESSAEIIRSPETESEKAADDSLDRPSKPAEMARESSGDVDRDAPAERRAENGPSRLEDKLSALGLEESAPERTERAGKTGVAKEGHGTERDSANHSPADVMLESPSISNYSDAQSEGSSDSGKGGSDVATPPSRTPASGSSVAGDLPPSSVYEFVLPQVLVGRLIGRHGIVVHQIKAKTNANIFIKRHPETAKMKICAIEGTPMDIESALEMIRQKFPQKRFPNVTLEQVSFLPPVTTFPLASEYFQLPLIEGVNNDVIVSSLVTPEHCFLQQPTHPTYLALSRLNMCMNLCYNEPNSPVLPLPVKEDVVCVAPTMGGWFRAQVVTSYPENETCDVRFLDYGGYLNVAQTDLRQIRQDFLTLPFQAAECYLANVKPVDGVWVPEAAALFEQLTHGQVIQAQIHGYADNGIPVVYLFSIQASGVVVVNQELVSRGFADLHEPAEEEPSAPVDCEVLTTVQQDVTC